MCAGASWGSRYVQRALIDRGKSVAQNAPNTVASTSVWFSPQVLRWRRSGSPINSSTMPTQIAAADLPEPAWQWLLVVAEHWQSPFLRQSPYLFQNPALKALPTLYFAYVRPPNRAATRRRV